MINLHLSFHGILRGAALVINALNDQVVEVLDDCFELCFDLTQITLERSTLGNDDISPLKLRLVRCHVAGCVRCVGVVEMIESEYAVTKAVPRL